jgi:hypothetical protein
LNMPRPPLSSFVKIEPVSDASELPALASVFDVAAKASGDTFHELLRRYAGGDVHQQLVEQLQAAYYSTGTSNTDDSGSGNAGGLAKGQHFVFKAVVVEETTSPTTSDDAPDGGGQEFSGHGHDPGGAGVQQKDHQGVKREEIVVGMAHWTVGYIDLSPKVDPFEEHQPQLALAPSSASVGAEDSPPTRAVPLEDPIVKSSGSGGKATAATKEEGAGQPFDFYAVIRKPVRNTYISQIRGKKHVCKFPWLSYLS